MATVNATVVSHIAITMNLGRREAELLKDFMQNAPGAGEPQELTNLRQAIFGALLQQGI